MGQKRNVIYTNLANEDQEFLNDLSEMLGYQIYHEYDRRYQQTPKKIWFSLQKPSLDIENNHIQTLICRDSKLSDFPASCAKLPFLKSLTFDTVNGIVTFPSNIQKIPHLKQLILVRLKGFTHIPDCIKEMKELEKLEIMDTPLDTIPSYIDKLINLEILEIIDCQLKKLPDSIGNLINLKKLLLSNNKLSEIPLSIANLKSLRELDLRANPIQYFPYHVLEIKYVDLLMETNLLIPEDKKCVKNMENPIYGFNYLRNDPLINAAWEKKKKMIQEFPKN